MSDVDDGEIGSDRPPAGCVVRAVDAAFGTFRRTHGPAQAPRFIRYDSDRDQMTAEDDLVALADGPGAVPTACRSMEVSDAVKTNARVWAVRTEDVVHAPKFCSFGTRREAGEVKHSNLTGGGDAFAAGELIFVDEYTIVVNGDSGRYGPRSAREMHDVAIAFRDSGYTTYTMGFDADANKPFSFHFVGAPAPELV